MNKYHILLLEQAPLLERGVRSEGRGVCAKTENTRSLGRGCLKSEQVRSRGERGSKNHPIHANVIIEWSFAGKMTFSTSHNIFRRAAMLFEVTPEK